MLKRIVILGAGESGTGAAVLAKKEGFDVFVSDYGKIKLVYKQVLDNHSIEWEEGKHTEDKILNADEIIKSPGISDKAIIMTKVKEYGIQVISEIEFAGRFTRGKKICITGSNGKTTTTNLIFHILKNAGLNVGLAGNIGKSFAMQVATGNFDYHVIELSSFQLDNMYDFKADLAILLNITPDHLDRYDYSMEKYIAAKFRITRNLTPDDYFIYCEDDEITTRELDIIVSKAKQLSFSLKKRKITGAYIKDENMKVDFDDIDFSMSLHELSMKGRHNTYNSMAAGIAGNVLRIRKEIIRESLANFKGVEHRLENFLKVHGIEFINDSKATNINSTWYALESINANVVWIAGGIDKGNDYSILHELVKKKVKALICLGKDNSSLHESFGGIIKTIHDAGSMKEAVQSAYYLAENGDKVLLSPACASFDLFDNYEDRGNQFKKYVRKL